MFVTLEGIDRSGKTTQAAMLAEALGPDTLLIREPGGTEMAEAVRSLLKDPALEMDDVAELLLFSAARADLARRVIEPARAAGRDVVCDRLPIRPPRNRAWRGESASRSSRNSMELVVGSCMPERTVLLRVDPDAAHARGQQRLAAGEADGTDRFEAEGVEFQRAVASAYDEIAAQASGADRGGRRRGRSGGGPRRVLEAVSSPPG